MEFHSVLKKFGFGSKTGIDLPGESVGLLPYWTQWDQGIHATMSYGYGTSVTAMQMISAAQTLANNGVAVLYCRSGRNLFQQLTTLLKRAKTVCKLFSDQGQTVAEIPAIFRFYSGSVFKGVEH